MIGIGSAEGKQRPESFVGRIPYIILKLEPFIAGNGGVDLIEPEYR
jgi:hypothetical protein